MALQLESQYNYYEAHESELLEQYQGMHLVISDTFQVYPFASPKEGYQFGVKTFGAGNFLLHKCVPGSLNVVHTINIGCTPIEELIAEDFGAIGTPQRTEFEISCDAFIIGEQLKMERLSSTA